MPDATDVLEALERSFGVPARSKSRWRRGWLIRRLLLLADVVGLLAAFIAAELIWVPWQGHRGTFATHTEVLLFICTMPLWVVAAKLYGLYDKDEERTDHSTGDEVITFLHMITLGAWLLAAGAWVTGVATPDLPKLVTFWFFALVLVASARASVRAYCRRTPNYVQNTIVIGAGTVGQLFARKILQHPEYGLNLLGFVDRDTGDEQTVGGLPVLGSPDSLTSLIQELEVERVIVAFPQTSTSETLGLIYSLSDENVQIDVVPQLYELVGAGIGIHSVEGLPLLGLAPFRLSSSSHLLKRTMDICVSLLGLVLFAPVLLGIALAVRLDSRGPAIFSQVRRGAGETVFRVLKFRTMSADADDRKLDFAHLNKHLDPRMFKIEDDPRVTQLGRFLRRYNLDELPQLINVLKGEMSLVGPRPLILDEDQHVQQWARKRLDLKPGMTGLWQVLGASSIPFEDMVRLDYLYVTTWSLSEDVRLLLRTIPVVFRGRAD